MRVTYPSHFIRVCCSSASRFTCAVSESQHLIHGVRVTVSESRCPSHGIRVTVSESRSPSHGIRVAVCELRCPNCGVRVAMSESRPLKLAPVGFRGLCSPGCPVCLFVRASLRRCGASWPRRTMASQPLLELAPLRLCGARWPPSPPRIKRGAVFIARFYRFL